MTGLGVAAIFAVTFVIICLLYVMIFNGRRVTGGAEHRTAQRTQRKSARQASQANIAEFLRTAPIDEIKKKLLSMLDTEQYCQTVLGKGAFGTVVQGSIGDRMAIDVASSRTVPIVKKIANPASTSTTSFTDIDGTMYITNQSNLTGETLILLLIRELWEAKKSPHLALILGYSNCENRQKPHPPVSLIILERYGLPKQIKYPVYQSDVSGYLSGHTSSGIGKIEVSSHLTSVAALIEYIIACHDGDYIALPSAAKVYIPELIDALIIEYLTAICVLENAGIIPVDTTANNVVLQWLSPDSWFGDHNLNGVKHIVYTLSGGKKITVNTHGVIARVGDVGTFVAHPQEKLYIFGWCSAPKNGVEFIKRVREYGMVYDLLMSVRWKLPGMFFGKTTASKIFGLPAYAALEDKWYLPGHKMPSARELLDVFADDARFSRSPSGDDVLNVNLP